MENPAAIISVYFRVTVLSFTPKTIYQVIFAKSCKMFPKIQVLQKKIIADLVEKYDTCAGKSRIFLSTILVNLPVGKSLLSNFDHLLVLSSIGLRMTRTYPWHEDKRLY